MSWPLGVVGLTFAGCAVLAFAYAIARDADARGSGVPTVWGAGSVALWPAGVYYLLVYARRRERSRSTGRGERAAATVAAAGTVAFVFTAVFAPPDPSSQLVWLGVAGPLSLVPGYALVYRRGYRRLRFGSG
ncbi:DUF7534 family protein [Halobaculum rarum]|uniref:DUF7534 family protein n=1 Tax=Halobaculum rarum TaxID=3075122 RepID=UPI0032AEC076